jgi:hypothetical protein
LYYSVDDQGNYVPSDPSTAYYIFTGTLDYTLDQNGNPVDMVQLYSEHGAQTVVYNITFSNAEFKSTVVPEFDITQPSGGQPWVISFLVNLSQAEVDLDDIQNQTAKNAIQNATNSLDSGMFSIQQLYLDLNTAVYDSSQNISGMNSFAESIFTGIMQSYLSTLQQSGGVIFGYSVQSTGSSTTTTPTFLPTALDFCVTPYTDETGNHSDPGLDTLNYLVMTGDHSLPPQVPTGFGFNWVTDDTTQGAIAIRSGLYINFLLNQLSPILNTISPVCYVEANLSASATNQTMELNSCSGGQQFTLITAPQNCQIAEYS